MGVAPSRLSVFRYTQSQHSSCITAFPLLQVTRLPVLPELCIFLTNRFLPYPVIMQKVRCAPHVGMVALPTDCMSTSQPSISCRTWYIPRGNPGKARSLQLQERFLVEQQGLPGFFHVVARYGYNERVVQDASFVQVGRLRACNTVVDVVAALESAACLQLAMDMVPAACRDQTALHLRM
jgi:hypothetical protein